MLRKMIFWGLDYLTGGMVANAYNEIKLFDGIDSHSSLLAEHQQSALNKLFQHAKSTTGYYHKIAGDKLTDFPVINKNIIRENQDDFMSARYEKKRLPTMSTSGSTGVRFISYQNIEKKKRVNAEIIYYSGKSGYEVGKQLLSLDVTYKESYKSKLLQWIQNKVLLDVSILSDKDIEILLKRIEKLSANGTVMLADASTYDVLADYFRRKNIQNSLKCKITGIISSSELLSDNVRELLSESFNSRCLSRYANQENGVIGQDGIENNTFILNEADYIIEIFKMDSDELAPDGETGRIVLTDLYNYAMPMIRYDTGDIGAIKYINKDGVQKRAITDFGGRRIDAIYDCDGKRLTPHIITVHFWVFPEIIQYQVIQETKQRYTVKLNVRQEFKQQDELHTILRTILGKQAEITIEFVDEIPVLSSGKRKYIVNMMAT